MYACTVSYSLLFIYIFFFYPFTDALIEAALPNFVVYSMYNDNKGFLFYSIWRQTWCYVAPPRSCFINYINISHWCLWSFFISPESSSWNATTPASLCEGCVILDRVTWWSCRSSRWFPEMVKVMGNVWRVMLAKCSPSLATGSGTTVRLLTFPEGAAGGWEVEGRVEWYVSIDSH